MLRLNVLAAAIYLLGASFYIDLFGAAYSLPDQSFWDVCPFMQQEAFGTEIARLQGMVKSELDAKLAGHQECIAPLDNIQNNLVKMDDLFRTDLNPAKNRRIADEVYQNQLMEAEADLVIEGPEGSQYSTVLSRVYNLQDKIATNQISGRWDSDNYTFQNNSRYLSQAFGYLDSAVNSMKTLRPECVALLGGWQYLTPVLLNSASSLAGLAGFAYSGLIGANLKLIGTLVSFFQDFKVKKAVANLARQQNAKVLACTYYSVQTATCQFKRALKFSKNTERLRKEISGKFVNAQTDHYRKFLSMWRDAKMFKNILSNISQTGSTITFDQDKVNTYLAAKKVSPYKLLQPSDIGPPPLKDDQTPGVEERRQVWLFQVKERGVIFRESSFAGPRSLTEQIKEALLDIEKRKNDIRTLERFFTSRRSFLDLKGQLDSNPQIKGALDNYINYFDRVYDDQVIQISNKGMIEHALRILRFLQAFLDLKYPIDRVKDSEAPAPPVNQTPFDLYRDRVNAAGERLFREIARDSIAEISVQNIFFIADAVQSRINQIFFAVEERFIAQEARDALNPQPILPGAERIRYSEYKRNFLLLTQVTANLSGYIGSPLAFKSEDIGSVYEALENGFAKELRKIIKDALIQKHSSIILPEMHDETASHMCALFIPFLANHHSRLPTRSTRKIFDLCKEKYTHLPLFDLVKPNKLEIDWENPCFYNDYRRLLATQRSVYQKMVELGYSVDQGRIDEHACFPGPEDYPTNFRPKFEDDDESFAFDIRKIR